MRILLFLTISFFLNQGQGPQFKLIKKIETRGKSLTTDALGNVYIENDRKIFKYDYDGKLINNFSNNNFGEISSVDATNPYKLLVFYQRFGKLIFLDNMLSENGNVIDLINSQFSQASLVSHSFDNGYWIYEPLLNELFKVNQELKVIQQTGNLSRILRKKLNPNFLIEYNNRLYLNNPATGVLVFDIYGTYIKTIPIKNMKDFQVREDRLHYICDQNLCTYFYKSLETDTIKIPIEENIIGLQVQKKRMFVLSEAALRIYEL